MDVYQMDIYYQKLCIYFTLVMLYISVVVRAESAVLLLRYYFNSYIIL